ncbi:Ring-infected erythrocyte surface antigen, putative [Pediculus humanus corporis]|uniref:Ring-infected erythrocyte surface antigen, putative n=1 Tax=Pediculus humanus subsp. corporis TaxID=121224 RepID=E0VM16_PEDHC|nr:Ring-infected erythrocyte surface antigen, putative [Pediculus humanus corporis]EEB14422.1 Ring-infected erythrocyte surface antigen, putative [Pediculus humanus corporis]
MHPAYYIVFGIVFVKIGFVNGGLINKEYIERGAVISNERNEEATPTYTNNKKYLIPDDREANNYDDVVIEIQNLRFKRSNFSLLGSLQTVPNKLYSKISESLKKNVNKAKALAGILQSAAQNKNDNETCENKDNDMTNTCTNMSPETNTTTTTTTIINVNIEGNNTLHAEKNDIVHNGTEINAENNIVSNLNHTIQNNNKTELNNVNGGLPVNENQTTLIDQENSEKNKHEGNSNHTVMEGHENESINQINIEKTKGSEEKINENEKPNVEQEIHSVNNSKTVEIDSELTRILQQKVFFKDGNETLESLLKKTMEEEMEKRNTTTSSPRTIHETLNSIPPRINSETFEKGEPEMSNNVTHSTEKSLLEKENTEKYDLVDKNNFVNDINITTNTSSYKNEENKSIETSTFPGDVNNNNNLTVINNSTISDKMKDLLNKINETIGTTNTFPQTHITFKNDEGATTVSSFDKNPSPNKEQNAAIFLQTDTWNCTYSNLHLNIENRSLEYGRTLIKAPMKCAAGEQLINSKCRKVYGI